MNKNKLKSYAQNARREFIKAVIQSAAVYGINEKGIRPCEEKGDFCFINGKEFPKSVLSQRNKLEEHIQSKGFYQAMEDAAYTWFNRFAAIRFMELKGYLSHGYRVLSHPQGKREPEILEKAQYIDRLDGLTKDKIIQLKLDNKEEELYNRLLLAQCNELGQVMPFLFEKINDYTELLMPKYLLRNDSLIRTMVNKIAEEDWGSVEIIGWLYQFYISEKKDEVIGSKKAIKTEDIPAATQLFTPNWIVKYLVQNSLGAKWLNTYPSSSIKQEMEYYIEPAEQIPVVVEEIKKMTLASLNPEELTVMDPACGSGHMLVEAYNLLKSIYLERGYRKHDIPKLILKKNLYGLEIDERAAQLSGFALMMKAREDDRQIFKNGINLNILCLRATKYINVNDTLRNLESLLTGQYSSFPSEKYKFMGIADGPLFANQIMPEEKKEKSQFIIKNIKKLLELFIEADTLGSLIKIPSEIGNNLSAIKQEIESLDISGKLEGDAVNLLKPIFRQAEVLYQKYDIVITNPPYMGSGGMNAILREFAKTQYPETKLDLFAMFIERGFEIAKEDIGFNAMVTMQSWMFLSSFEKCRELWMKTKTITTMAHLGARAFSTISGEVVTVTAFTFLNDHIGKYKPYFLRLINCNEEEKRQGIINKINAFSHTIQDDFKKIPGSPIAYWVNDRIKDIFDNNIEMNQRAQPKQGLITGDNNRFLRQWYELCFLNIGYDYKDRETAKNSRKKWFPYNKGGGFRKWYGNLNLVVNWQNDGDAIRNNFLSNGKLASRPQNLEYYFKKGITWTALTSNSFNARFSKQGILFDAKGPLLFPNTSNIFYMLGLLNSCVSIIFLKILAPTLDFNQGPVGRIPFIEDLANKIQIEKMIQKCIKYAKYDWDSFEISWDFEQLAILKSDNKLENLYSSYKNYRSQCQQMTDKMKQLEEENNRIFIDAYGLQDELTPDVPIKEITLFANPHYRYNSNLTDDEREKRFKADTMKELISYATGCMMGRYSLDKPGLIYAHNGNIGFDHSQYRTFPADKDGIIPITDSEWFDDDILVKLVKFIEVAWGKETLEENLNFIAESLKQRSGETSRDAIRRYFVNDFYKDHLKTYKKRPIYWLFSSGKQKAFQALVYLHRYNMGTLSRMRTEYVLPLQGSISRHIEHLKKEKEAASTSAGTKIQKEINILRKQNEELLSFDEKLKHWADMKIELDLDDGVKVNYGKFGNLLAEVMKVAGEKK